MGAHHRLCRKRANFVLYLTRKIGETIVINENIEISVISVNGKVVKLGLNFPPDATVLRKEVLERIQMENRAAAKTAPDLTKLRLPEVPIAPPPVAKSEPDTDPEAGNEAS